MDKISNVIFSDQEKKEIMEPIKKAFEKDMLSFADDVSEKLYYAAKKYLATMEEVTSQLITLDNAILNVESKKKSLMKAAGFESEDALSKSLNQYISEKQKIQDKFTKEDLLKKMGDAVFTFQDYLNATINQKIETVFVYYSSASFQPTVFKWDVHDIISVDTHSLELRYNFGLQSLNQKADAGIIKRLDMEDSNNRKNLDKTFSASVHRFKKTGGAASKYASKKRKTKKEKSSGARGEAMFKNRKRRTKSSLTGIYWWAKKQRGFIRVGQVGDISEGYAVAVLDEYENQKKKFINEDLEVYISVLALEYIKNVDNKSGLLMGDTENKEGTIQYNIKSMKAATLSFKQITDVAKEIVNLAKAGNPAGKKWVQDKKDELDKNGSVRNTVIDFLTEKPTKDMEKMLLDLGVKVKS